MEQGETRLSITVGFIITGSFCTFARIGDVLQKMVDIGMRVIPIFSERTQTTDNRFGNAKDFMKEVERITGENGIYTITQAEPIGPKAILDAAVIAPCTGNTLAKLANGITDSTALMAAKAHLRNERPLIIAMSTNDALGINFKNIGMLMNMKNVYFVPFGQDDCTKKHKSMVAHMELIPDTIEAALKGSQLQPVIM